MTGHLIDAGRKFSRSDFIYAATRGDEGEPPAHTSHRFAWVRRAVMRSDWGPDALYAMLETAPFGHAHQHEDALTFELMAFGQPLVGTMGRYTYARVPERHYLTGSRGHNVVLIDGHGQDMRSIDPEKRNNETWIATKKTRDPWIHTPKRDMAWGRFDGPWAGNLKEISWERRLVFSKPDTRQKRPAFWIIHDQIAGKGEHALEFLLHFYPGEVSLNSDIGEIITDYGPGRGNVVIRVSNPEGIDIESARGQKDPVRGWFSEEYGKIDPAWTAAICRQAHLPFTQTMLFVPFRDNVPDVALDVASDGVSATINGKAWPVPNAEPGGER